FGGIRRQSEAGSQPATLHWVWDIHSRAGKTGSPNK
ncbi:unnamed protein product, partial [marine sediment metagenome]